VLAADAENLVVFSSPAAMWKGSLVAVKTMLLPAAMSGKERREKMAIMETAISASLSHPNIVQVRAACTRSHSYKRVPCQRKPQPPKHCAGDCGPARGVVGQDVLGAVNEVHSTGHLCGRVGLTGLCLQEGRGKGVGMGSILTSKL
jgi:hypothetical protein